MSSINFNGFTNLLKCSVFTSPPAAGAVVYSYPACEVTVLTAPTPFLLFISAFSLDFIFLKSLAL